MEVPSEHRRKLPPQSAEEQTRQADEAGKQPSEAGIEAYEDAGLIVDFLQFWRVRMTTFPLLYCIALESSIRHTS
ncbi:hypothetical protein D9619_000395 [Psilocybe cf. subviscida]|uniref:Uncharacterized protein n=1 Tax=Psilocybe cf. subviscida TaxID=2480587 RepID=A0A8H5BCR8_9AGAR|nr:hypothetical protein D9619_000395 [Psilocybe cf. subviscida]